MNNTTTTKTPTTMTTAGIPFPPENNGTQRTPLDDFVYSDKSLSEFTWFHASEFDFNGTNGLTNVSYTAHVLNMTSGTWQTGKKSEPFYELV